MFGETDVRLHAQQPMDVVVTDQNLEGGARLATQLVGGIPTPLKNIKVSWDDDIPNIWKVINFMFQTTNQSCYREGNNSKNSEH